jgi:hypothetical protein
MGNPNPDHISTRYVERHKLTERMSLCRFTLLTTIFSDRRNMTDHMWEIREIVDLLSQRYRGDDCQRLAHGGRRIGDTDRTGWISEKPDQGLHVDLPSRLVLLNHLSNPLRRF